MLVDECVVASEHVWNRSTWERAEPLSSPPIHCCTTVVLSAQRMYGVAQC